MTSKKLSVITCHVNIIKAVLAPPQIYWMQCLKLILLIKIPFCKAFQSHIAISYPSLPNVPCHQHELSVVLRKYVSNSSECIRVNGEALQLHVVYKSRIFLLQVTRESILSTTSHVHCIWTCNEIEGSYGKIIITMRSTKLYRKKYHSFVAISIVTRAVHL